MNIIEKIYVYISENKILQCALLVVSVAIIIAICIHQSKKKIKKHIYHNRAKNCLMPYNNFKVNFKKLVKTYYNPYYKKQVHYFLRDYYISTSYKSYMPCGHTNDICSYNALKDVLNKGARCINLDLYYEGDFAYDEYSKIIVGNVIDGKLNYLKDVKKQFRYLYLDNCLQIIKDYAWKKCNYPLLLYLNFEFVENKLLESKIYEILLDKISDKFLNKLYGFQRYSIGDIPIEHAINKIVLLTNRKPVYPLLNEIINGTITPNGKSCYELQLTEKDDEYGGIKSKFVKKDDAIELTKFTMTYVYKYSEPNENNVYSPKINTNNLNFKTSFDVGVQLFAMNFQNYPGKNKEMEKYIKFFKNGGFVPKPIKNKTENTSDNLVYMIQPPKKLLKQNKSLYYNNRNTNSDAYAPGWFNLNY